MFASYPDQKDGMKPLGRTRQVTLAVVSVVRGNSHQILCILQTVNDVSYRMELNCTL